MVRDVFTDIRAQEARLGLPEGFYLGLFNDGDWSFVIKLNALIEASCTHALVARLHAPELSGPLSSLDLGHSKYGKVALLRALGALSSDQANVLQLLYQLRNTLAHDIKQVSFSFEQHLAAMDKQQRSNFFRGAGHGVNLVVGVDGKEMGRDEFVANNPKLALWMTVAEIIACLYLEHEASQVRLERLALESLRRARDPSGGL